MNSLDCFFPLLVGLGTKNQFYSYPLKNASVNNSLLCIAPLILSEYSATQVSCNIYSTVLLNVKNSVQPVQSGS